MFNVLVRLLVALVAAVGAPVIALADGDQLSSAPHAGSSQPSLATSNAAGAHAGAWARASPSPYDDQPHLARSSRADVTLYGYDAATNAAETEDRGGQAHGASSCTRLEFVAPNTIHPSEIRLSQATVNGPGTSALTDSMQRNGWQGDPIDVVRMPDGGLTAFDNKRVVAANDAGIDVQANIHDFDAPFPSDWLGPKSPGTWGEAVTDRIDNQKRSWRNCYPMGAPFTCRNGD